MRCVRGLFFFFILVNILWVKSESYDKKTIEGMVLKMLWEKVYEGFDAKMKEVAITQIRKTGDYNHLIDHLLKAKKEKVEKIINLVGEVMIAYMA